MIICSCCFISDKDTKEIIKEKIKITKERCLSCDFFKCKKKSKENILIQNEKL